MRVKSINPASYWRSVGYSGPGSEIMEKLQRDLVSPQINDNDGLVIGPKHSSGDRVESVPYREEDVDDFDRYTTFIPYDEALQSHWKNFAIGLSTYTGLEKISLFCVELPSNLLANVLSNLKRIQLKKLELFNNPLEVGVFNHIFDFVRGSASLHELKILPSACPNKFCIDLDTARYMSNAIQNHPSLKFFDLKFCNVSKPGVLEAILVGCKRLEKLSLCRNNLGSAEAGVISDFVKSNTSIGCILLNDNRFEDRDVPTFVSALKSNTNIKYFGIGDNNLTMNGKHLFQKAVYDPSSMESLAQCNHYCFLSAGSIDLRKENWSVDNDIVDINTGQGLSLEQKIRKKVCQALCGGFDGLFDLSLLDGLPLELKPRVLEFLQEKTPNVVNFRHDGTQLARLMLTRVFHFVRGGGLFSLFEERRSRQAVRRSKRKRSSP